MSELFLILLTISLSCGLIGSLLVLKNQSIAIDALSHSVLLGIVLGFFISQNLDSPFLILGANLFALLTLYLIDYLHAHHLPYDTATGLIFPLFFSIAVILISLFAKNSHLDLDIALSGEIIFAPLHRMTLFNSNLPISLFKGSISLIINSIFIFVFQSFLRIYLFDKDYAKLSGISVSTLKFMISSLACLTSVIAFEAFGTITVVSLFVAPALISLVWTKSFYPFLFLIIGNATLACLLSYQVYNQFDISLTGATSFIYLPLYFINLFCQQWLQKKAKL